MTQYIRDHAEIMYALYRAHQKEKFRYAPGLTGVDCGTVYDAMKEGYDWLQDNGWIARTADQGHAFVLTKKGWEWCEEQEELGILGN